MTLLRASQAANGVRPSVESTRRGVSSRRARQRVIITSNTPPEKWYPDGDEAEFVGEMLRDIITSSGGVTRFE